MPFYFPGWYERKEEGFLVGLFVLLFFPPLNCMRGCDKHQTGEEEVPTAAKMKYLFLKNNLKSCFPLSKTAKYQQQRIPHRFAVLEKKTPCFFKCQPAPVLTLLFLCLLKFPTPSPAGDWVMFCRWALLSSQLCSTRFFWPFCSTLWSSLTHLQNFGCQLKNRTFQSRLPCSVANQLW